MALSDRITKLTTEILETPFFPLLFFSESVKLSAFLAAGASVHLPSLGASYLLSALSAITWVFFHDKIEWGVNYVEEQAEAIEDEVDS